MKRRLIKQGAGCFTVTLPIEWIRSHNLDAGKEVECVETEQGVLVSAGVQKKEQAMEIDISKYDRRMILNILNQLYRLGYDIIRLRYHAPVQLHWIEEITQTLLGFEVVEQSNQMCVLQNIAEPDGEKFEVILRKMFLQILVVSEQVTRQLQDKKYHLQPLYVAKEQIDRLTNYCRRSIIKFHQGDKKAFLLYDIISKLSLISHAYLYALDAAEKRKIKCSASTLKHLDCVNNMVKEYYAAFYKKDLTLLNKLGSDKEKLYTQNDVLLLRKLGKENILLAYFREIIRNVHMCTPSAIGYVL